MATFRRSSQYSFHCQTTSAAPHLHHKQSDFRTALPSLGTGPPPRPPQTPVKPEFLPLIWLKLLACSYRPRSQHGPIEFLSATGSTPFFCCPPLGPGVGATAGTRDLKATNTALTIEVENRNNSDSVSPTFPEFWEMLLSLEGVWRARASCQVALHPTHLCIQLTLGKWSFESAVTRFPEVRWHNKKIHHWPWVNAGHCNAECTSGHPWAWTSCLWRTTVTTTDFQRQIPIGFRSGRLFLTITPLQVLVCCPHVH